ncbi:MAG: spermidine synthase, partial [Polyangia bacterium]
GNARSDASTQVMAGLMGALVHPGVHRSLVVGLGTGSTAGWLGQVPTMERVDVVELEPAILEVARRCAAVNRDVLANPRVHVTIGDAREVVGTTRARYDLIFSEPSNPYRAGIASLFTHEFYRAASLRLEDDGLFVQWLQAYNVDAQTIRTIYATLASVFPDVETWITEESDLLLVAGKRPLHYDVAKLRARIAEEPWHTALSRVWRADDLEAVFARYVANADFARGLAALEGNHLNTDDMTLVEFGFARGLGFRTHQFEVAELRSAAVEHGFGEPRLVDGTLDRAIVAERALSMAGADWRAPAAPPANAPPGLQHRGSAIEKWEDGAFTEALAEWRAQDREPEDSIELAMLAESLADAGDATAERFIAKLRPAHAIEADLFSARLAFRQRRVAEAGATLERVFAAATTDPWPLPVVLGRGLDLAVDVAVRDHAAGERLWRALEQPFAVHVQNDHRLRARIDVAWAVDRARLCTEALAPMEPEAPFDVELLQKRVRCYEANGDRRAIEARHDLSHFSGHEPMRFGNGLGGRKPR